MLPVSIAFTLLRSILKSCLIRKFICYFCSDLAEMFEGFNFPESYRINSNKETLALSYAENFRKQFVHLYRDRKPLLLSPLNELQVEACLHPAYWLFALPDSQQIIVHNEKQLQIYKYC